MPNADRIAPRAYGGSGQDSDDGGEGEVVVDDVAAAIDDVRLRAAGS